MADLVANDTGAVLTVTVLNDQGTIVDVTDCTVEFIFNVDNGRLLATRSVEMVLADPVNGVVTYQFLDTDLPTQTVRGRTTSTLRGEVRVTDADGFSRTSTDIAEMDIRNRIG